MGATEEQFKGKREACLLGDPCKSRNMKRRRISQDYGRPRHEQNNNITMDQCEVQ
jgi:hypothetical protein